MTELKDRFVVANDPISGPLEKIADRAELQLDKKRETMIRNRFGGYDALKREWTVTIQPVQGKRNTVPDPITRKGDIFDDAVYEASRNGKVKHQGDITVVIEETFEIPYKLEPSLARDRSRSGLMQALGDEVDRLQERYGGRMPETPHEIFYEVLLYSGPWQAGKEDPVGKVVARGTSTISIEAAETQAVETATSRGKTHQASVFKARHTYKLYDFIEIETPEPLSEEETRGAELAAPVGAAGVAAAGVSESRKYGGSGPGASITPDSATYTDLF